MFAPVAAHLARGEAPSDLGEPMDAAELTELERTPAVIEPGRRVEAISPTSTGSGTRRSSWSAAELVDSGLKLGHRVWVEGGGVTLDAVYL